MNIAVPVANEQLCMHFGHCESFALFKTDAEKQEIISEEYLQPPAHEPGVLPRWLHEQGANVIIAGGMGQRAQQLFTANDIKVIVGAPTGHPRELVTAYLQNKLESGDNVCDH